MHGPSQPGPDQVPASYKYGWHDPEMKPLHVMKKGLSREVVEEISRIKGEPQWMTDLRLKAYRHFEARPMPTWGGDYRARSTSRTSSTTSPPPTRRSSPGTTCRTTSGAPTTGWASPRRRRSTSPASAAQYDSEVVYHNIRERPREAGRHLPGDRRGADQVPRDLQASTSARSSRPTTTSSPP